MIHRVSFVVTSETLGGGELFTTRFAEALSQYVPVRIVGAAGSPVLADAESRNIPIATSQLGRKLSSRTAVRNTAMLPLAQRRLDRLMREAPNDLFVFQYKWEEILWAGRHSHERVVLWEHGPIPRGVLKMGFARARLSRAVVTARNVFAISEPARDAIHDLSGRKAEMLYAGVDIDAAEKARANRESVRASLDIDDDSQAVVFAGRVTQDKGIFQAIAALKDRKSATLIVCGEGQEELAAHAAAEQAGVADRVRWLGWRTDVYDVLAASDVLMMLSTSHGEGRPLVALEALSVGTPVIGLRATPALDAMNSLPGVFLAASLAPADVDAALRDVERRGRAVPSGAGWGASAKQFLEAIGVERGGDSDGV